ncbi:hypothetical protein HDK77DRAFT_202096 [Phyllosticta capitalensis]|uniref:MYB DNA-binding domain-containing protein n=1 Tax=Phyllosticta capitalensis TaxID=121624 RepID=A0ABR1YXM1_9PEZI
MSSSSSKRNLKPTPLSASPSQLTVSGDSFSAPGPGAFTPSQQAAAAAGAGSTTAPAVADPFAGTAYAQQPMAVGSTTGGSPTNPRKRRASGATAGATPQLAPNMATIAPASVTATGAGTAAYTDPAGAGGGGGDPTMLAEGGAVAGAGAVQPPPPKKGRTNTPWTAAEEQRLKIMRDAGNSWSEIAKTFPTRTEGSVKKHWYKDMHYAEFAEDESAALLAAIKEYEASKWKVIGAKVGKPAKACEQYAKEHFGGKY